MEEVSESVTEEGTEDTELVVEAAPSERLHGSVLLDLLRRTMRTICCAMSKDSLGLVTPPHAAH